MERSRSLSFWKEYIFSQVGGEERLQADPKKGIKYIVNYLKFINSDDMLQSTTKE